MSIRNKIVILVCSIVIFLSFLLTIIHITIKKQDLLAGIDSKLLASAHFAKAMLPDGYHDKITDKSSVTKEEFKHIVNHYNNLCISLNLEYLWSVLSIGDQIIFTSATSPGKDVTKSDHASFLKFTQTHKPIIRLLKRWKFSIKSTRINGVTSESYWSLFMTSLGGNFYLVLQCPWRK